MGSRSRTQSVSSSHGRNSLVFLPSQDYNAIQSLWQPNYIWNALPVHGSLPLEQAAFVRHHDDIESMVGSEPADVPNDTYPMPPEAVLDPGGSAPVDEESQFIDEDGPDESVPVLPVGSHPIEQDCPAEPVPVLPLGSQPIEQNGGTDSDLESIVDYQIVKGGSVLSSSSDDSETPRKRRSAPLRGRKRYRGRRRMDASSYQYTLEQPLIPRMSEQKAVHAPQPGFRCHLSLDLEIEVQLSAKIQGNLILGLVS
ncbi:hypothetical protein BX600DRAFT_555191 [Xylariales sp. PMI_506]|nr:hypothetical protein BX600DRAFT_555191 [Xylariales sp. PMI_506]